MSGSSSMFTYDQLIRVCYGETDQMGFLYYGYYSLYYEQARTEAFRSLGIVYREMEKEGVMMPVLEMKAKYIRPARYDDLLRVRVSVKERPGTRIRTEYEVFNEQQELLNVAEVTLVFVDHQTFKPVMCPTHIMQKLEKYLEG